MENRRKGKERELNRETSIHKTDNKRTGQHILMQLMVECQGDDDVNLDGMEAF
jgi:hypothetical protein